jgi:hypothetical protein
MQKRGKRGYHPYLSKKTAETRATLALDWFALSINLKCPIDAKIGTGFVFDIDPQFAVGKFWRKIYKVLTQLNGVWEVFADLETDNVEPSVKHSCLRIHNKWLYHGERELLQKSCCEELGFEYIATNRVDMAFDFQRFESNICQDPEQFIKKVFNGDYLKTGRASFKAFAELPAALPPQQYFVYANGGERIKVTGCVFGKASSGMQIRMYNKSEEMRAKLHKPWIAEAWEQAGFDMSKDVWRIEFQVNVKDFMKCDRVTGDLIVAMKDLESVSSDRLLHFATMMYERHFKFHRRVKKCGNKRVVLHDKKRRLPSFYPLDITTMQFAKVKIVSEQSSGRTQRIEVKNLVKLHEDIKHQPTDVAMHVRNVIAYRVGQYGLHDWFY